MNASTVATNRPRRLLSIDGGGLCGIIPAQVLIAIEKQLDELAGDPQPLCNRFDLIGGTSTGAILAAGLALGLKAKEMLDFYVRLGPEIFTKVFVTERFWHKYPSGPLEKHLKSTFGEATTLGDQRLRTKVVLVTKNATLGNNWFFTNIHKNPMFARDAGIALWHVVRASSAAPTYFPPHAFAVPDETGTAKTYEFIDGGVSSYNNPSLQVFLEATLEEYGLGWPTGADNLLLMSLGTGFSPITIAEGKAAGYDLLNWAQYVLKELMNEATLEQNVLLRLMGEKLAPEPAGSMHTLAAGASSPGQPQLGLSSGSPPEMALARVSAVLGTKKLLTYQRITVGLTPERLKQLGLPDVDPTKVREMDAVDQIPNMQRVGEAVAKEQVHMERLIRFFR